MIYLYRISVPNLWDQLLKILKNDNLRKMVYILPETVTTSPRKYVNHIEADA